MYVSEDVPECPLFKGTKLKDQFHLATITFLEKKHVLVFRWVDTGGSLLKVLETTGGYDVEAFLPSTGEKANGNR